MVPLLVLLLVLPLFPLFLSLLVPLLVLLLAPPLVRLLVPLVVPPLVLLLFPLFIPLLVPLLVPLMVPLFLSVSDRPTEEAAFSAGPFCSFWTSSGPSSLLGFTSGLLLEFLP